MHFIWMVEDHTPLGAPAVKVGLTALAKSLGVVIPDDAVVVLQDDGVKGILSGHPLTQSWAPDGSVTWLADYEALANALFAVSDKAMRDAGLDPNEPTFERQARRLLQRRFPHWDEQTMAEAVGILPRIHNLSMSLEEGLFDGDDIDPR